MPIYEYRCTKCGHRFETIQKVSDPPLTKCEKCKGKAERLISSPAIQFKRSGWYITDYARKRTSESSGASSESSSSDGGSEPAGTKKKKKDKDKDKDKEKAGSTK
ncbi:MAG TPA: zinc ribbon domain-containing protein [Vicinamibacteria bacterium]|nr:zinc ribbon domain-containing protein [Vicinamibacteria bacterium]